MQIYRCDICGDYTEQELTVTFHDSLYSAGGVDLCPRCMEIVLDEFRKRISSPRYGEDCKRIEQIKRSLKLTSVKSREE